VAAKVCVCVCVCVCVRACARVCVCVVGEALRTVCGGCSREHGEELRAVAASRRVAELQVAQNERHVRRDVGRVE
jgi:hypothetical protein